MKKFTTQEIIDMGAQLYDRGGFDRGDIAMWLMAIQQSECAEFDFERIFDLIVG